MPPPREIILAKAGELFHRKGYAAVSVDEVIAASGLSKSEFHRAYSGKAALGKAWLERLTKRMRIMHDTFMERPGERERRLKKYFYSMRSWVEANGWRSCQFANTAAGIDADAEPELAHLIDQYKREQRKFFMDLVGTLVEGPDAQRLARKTHRKKLPTLIQMLSNWLPTKYKTPKRSGQIQCVNKKFSSFKTITDVKSSQSGHLTANS